MPSAPDNEQLIVGLAVAGIVILAYSVLVAQQLLLGASVVAWLLGLYLLWRFIRAHERIAAALEARNRDE
ncbi:hypothetical protein [Natronomonas amylolytica]|uniref:hypothetical protein n=1 Tax=Natronomonas amylolytica TaxID=3108498 RepID=UPI00300BC9D3